MSEALMHQMMVVEFQAAVDMMMTASPSNAFLTSAIQSEEAKAIQLDDDGSFKFGSECNRASDDRDVIKKHECRVSASVSVLATSMRE
jgi:hypothetical protein